MPFVDKNIHMTTKLHNFDIKCHCNSESYDQNSFFWTKFRVSQIFLNLRWEVFPTRESDLGLTGWNSLIWVERQKEKMSILIELYE